MATSAELKAVLDEAVVVSNIGSKIWCGQTYNDVFKGETLLDVLLRDPVKYPSRQDAVWYAQELLDARAIICITKRRTFDDGDRLYCVSQSGLDCTPTSNVKKSPSTKIAEDKKETVSKQNSQERTNIRNGTQEDKSVVGREEGLNGESSGLKSSSNLFRLLKKNSTERKFGPSDTSMASLGKPSVKIGLGSVNVVLNDKQPEGHKDENSVAKKINISSSSLNSKERAQKRELPYNGNTSKNVISCPHEMFSGKSEENEHLTLSIPGSNMRNGSQSLLEGDSSNDSKRLFSDNDRASVKGKQKVRKTVSPALTALIEKDARNSQTYRGNSKEGKQECNEKVNEDFNASVLEVNSLRNEKLLNSWDAFELKLQNKIRKSTNKRPLGNDARGQHEAIFTSKHEENGKISIQGISKDEAEKDNPEGQLLSQKREPTSKHKIYKDNLNSNKKLGVTREVLMPSITGRTSSLVGLKKSGKPEGKNIEKSTLGKEHSRKRAAVSSKDDSTNIVIKESTTVKNLRSDKALSSDEEDLTTTEKVASVSLRSDSLAAVVEEGDRKKTAVFSQELTIGKEDSGTRQRVPSVSLSDDPKNAAVEEGTFENRSHSIKNESNNRQTVSSFTLKGDYKTEGVNNGSQDINQSTSGTKNLVEAKGGNSITKPPSTSDNTSDSSIQEDLVQVDGHTISKAIAALLARDGASPEKKEQVAQNDDCSVFKNKLKELKKTRPRSGIPVVNNSKTEGQSSMKLPRGTSLSDYVDEKENNVSDKIVIYRSKNDREEIEKETTYVNEGCVVKVRSNLPTFPTSGPEDNLSIDRAFERSKATTVETKAGHDSFPNAKKEFGDDRANSVLISGDKLLMSQGKLPESSLSDYSVPHVDFRPGNSYKLESISTRSNRTDPPSPPDSLGVSPNSKSSPITSDAASPSQLRKELENSRKDFEESKRKYENKITELQLQVDFLRRQKSGQIDVHENCLESSASMSDLTSLYSSFSTPMVSPGNSNVTTPSPSPCVTPRGSTPEECATCSPRSPPPPPPAPPSVLSVPTASGNLVKPTKPVVNPRADMKPLFWNRIITSNDSNGKGKCVWETLKESAIDTAEFERLFSKKTTDRKLKRTKSLREDKHFAHIRGKRVAKLLDTNRSRAIGIKMSSLNCQLEDIKNAVYNMDTSVVDMESLQFIYDIYPKKEEIEIIQDHVKKLPSVPLDKPEEFMYQLTKMRHFKERLECWLFQNKLSEIIFGIDRSLACVTESCTVITTNAEIAALLSLVLAYGNYMNGNTLRGQADGFQLDILLRLRDVKNKESDMNLLQYIVKQHLKQHERIAEKGRGDSKLPSSVSLSNAAQVSFDKLREELLKVSLLLRETELQVKKIIDECSPAERNPFEEQMRRFQTMAKQNISEENVKVEKALEAFRETVEYFHWESEGKKETPQEFFALWAKFIEEVKNCVKLEKQQQLISKKSVSKTEHLNQIKEAASKFKKRRESIHVI